MPCAGTPWLLRVEHVEDEVRLVDAVDGDEAVVLELLRDGPDDRVQVGRRSASPLRRTGACRGNRTASRAYLTTKATRWPAW